MKREEASNYITEWLKDEYALSTKDRVVLNMALKALEQERSMSAEITQYRHDCEKLMEENERLKKALEQQPCEDCVSRKAFDEALYEHFHDEDALNNITEITLGAVRNFVKDFPSVTPTRKKGHWIKMHLVEAGQTYSHICSLCGRRILVTDAGLSEFPYCHCGAKMQEVKE